MKASRAKEPIDAGLRRRILDASVELVETEGLGALSLREVARRAGVSHQAPYHHFADREAILAAIAEEGFAELGRRMVESQQGATTAGDRLGRAGGAYVRFACAFPAHFRVMFRPDLVKIQQFPEASCAADATFDGLVALVDTCLADGLGATEERDALVSFAWALSHGLAALLLDGPLPLKVPAAADDRDGHIDRVMAFAGRLLEAGRTAPKKATTKKKRRAVR